MKEVTPSTTSFVTVLEVPDGSLTISGGVATVDMSGGPGHGVGSATQHADINSTGSGDIITVAERAKVTNISVTVPVDLDAHNTLLTSFNGANQLALLTGSGALPIISGENLTGVLKPSDIGTTVLSPSGDGSALVNLPSDTTKADNGVNSDIVELQGLTTPLSIAQGGTGSSTAANTNGGVVIMGTGSSGDAYPAASGEFLTGVLHYPATIDNATANKTVLVSDFEENKIFTTIGTATEVIFTLPSANSVIGMSCRFVKNEGLYNIQIKTSGTDKIDSSVEGGVMTTDAKGIPQDITVTSIGSGQFIVSANGTWLVDNNAFT